MKEPRRPLHGHRVHVVSPRRLQHCSLIVGHISYHSIGALYLIIKVEDGEGPAARVLNHGRKVVEDGEGTAPFPLAEGHIELGADQGSARAVGHATTDCVPQHIFEHAIMPTNTSVFCSFKYQIDPIWSDRLLSRCIMLPDP